MRAVLFLLVACVLGGESAFNMSCSETMEESVSVAAGDAPTRYEVRYCAKAAPRPARWELLLSVVRAPPAECSYERLGEGRAGASHSHSVEDVDPAANISCSFVCFSKSMDLMFRSCYRLENKVSRQQGPRLISSEPHNSYFFADNNVTGFSNDTSQYFHCNDNEHLAVCNWYDSDIIKITDYEMLLWPNATHSEEEASVVTGNCSRAGGGVQCALRVPPGCYLLQLRHTAPWRRGFYDRATHTAAFCHSSEAWGARAGGGAWAAWATGAAALAAAGAGGALLARRRRRLAKQQLLVWQDWLHRKGECEKAVPGADAGADVEAGADAEAGADDVLLLYARDCAPAARLAAALHALLLAARPPRAQVWDIHSASTMAASARAPHAWVRARLLAGGTRVLLLQTPALAAAPASPALVVRRAPSFGDSLLGYAARLLTDASPAHPAPYRKFFLATVEGLEVDVCPALVPYTRFPLPAAAPALLAALWPPAAPSAAPAPPAPAGPLRALAAAAGELLRHVADHPDYLAEEFVLLP